MSTSTASVLSSRQDVQSANNRATGACVSHSTAASARPAVVSLTVALRKAGSNARWPRRGGDPKKKPRIKPGPDPGAGAKANPGHAGQEIKTGLEPPLYP